MSRADTPNARRKYTTGQNDTGFQRAEEPTDLAPEILADLARSGLTPDDLPVRRVTRSFVLATFGRTVADRLDAAPAYSILYPQLNGTVRDESWTSCYSRTRFLDADLPKAVSTEDGSRKKKDKPPKYMGLPGVSPTPAYFPRLGLYGRVIDWAAILADASVTIWIVESEKAAALLCKHGVFAVAIGGVYSFKAGRLGYHDLTPDIRLLALRGRKIVLAFDSDKETNAQVMAALSVLGRALADRGALPEMVDIPAPKDGRDKNGPDDAIVEFGIDAFRALVPRPLPGIGILYEMAATHGYVEKQDRMVSLVTGEVMTIPAFHNRFAQHRYHVPQPRGGFKEIPATKVFFESPLRPNFYNLDYHPGQPRELPNRRVNTWVESFQGRPSNLSIYFAVRDFIFKDEGPAALREFDCLFAWMTQNPGRKIPIAILLFGREQGTGKTLLLLLAAAQWGSGISPPDDPRVNCRKVAPAQLRSEFNAYASGVQFVVGDELTTKKDKSWSYEDFKDTISRKFFMVNAKFIEAYSVADRANYGLTANDPRIVRIKREDRRLFGVHAPEEKPSGEIISKGYKWLEDFEVSGPAMKDYFENYDLDGFDPYRESGALWTRGKGEIVMACMNDATSTISEVMVAPEEMPRASGQNSWGSCDLWTRADFRSLFTEDLSEAQLRAALSEAGAEEIGRVTPPKPPAGYAGLKSVRVFAIRNRAKWRSAEHSELLAEYLRGHPYPKDVLCDEKLKGGNLVAY